MYEEEIVSNKLAYKLLNEIKYNKRYMYNWLKWSEEFSINQESTSDLLNLLSEKIQTIYDSFYSETSSENLTYIYNPVPILKKIKEKQNDNEMNIISFDNNKEINEDDMEFNYFFHCDINTLALSIIWTETVGKMIDDSLEDNVYANRLSDKKSVFKPYFNSYSNFRDNSFQAMKKFTKNNKTGVYIQTDLTDCFYNINIGKLKKKVNKIISGKKEYLSINNKVFEIIEDYYESLKDKTDKYNKDLGGLPIGFLPSNILINLYLSDLDNMIINEFHPVEYGRYVDDIGFLISTNIQTSNKIDIIKDLEEKLDFLFKKEKLEIKKSIEKTIFFVITKNSDENYLKKFEKSIRELSSDNYRLIDTVGFEEELNKSYIISESPTKLDEMFKIERDKKHLSRIISTIFYSLFETFSVINKNEKLSNKNEKLIKYFIETFFNLIDDQFFLELFDYWYQLVVIELSYMGNIKDFRDYKKTKTYAKITELLGKYDNNKEIKSFLELYKDLLDALKKGNSLLDNFQDYFRLPSFKVESLKEYFLNYEKQLYDIWGWYKNEGTSIDSLLEVFRSKSGSGSGSGSETGSGGYNLKNEDYPAEDEIIIGQANIHSYGKRQLHFMKYSENLSTQSDFTKIFNEALEYNADILIFPEQGLTFENLPFIARQSAKNRIAVIGGFDFILKDKVVKNLSVAIIPEQAKYTDVTNNEIFYNDARIYLAPKKYPAPLEYSMFHNSTEYEETHRSREIYIPDPNSFPSIFFNYLGKKHAVLNCYEATDLETKYKLSKREPLITHLITNNTDTKYFEKIAINLSREIMGAITITNYAEFGGTLVYVPFTKRYKRTVSAHKGANNTHVDISKVNLKEIGYKRRNNLSKDFKQNPPKYYYRNLGWEWESE